MAGAQLPSAALHLWVTPSPSNNLLSQVLPDSGPGDTYSFRSSLPSTSHVRNRTLGVVKSIKLQRTFPPPPPHHVPCLRWQVMAQGGLIAFLGFPFFLSPSHPLHPQIPLAAPAQGRVCRRAQSLSLISFWLYTYSPKAPSG